LKYVKRIQNCSSKEIRKVFMYEEAYEGIDDGEDNL
jgi:hypothetical protein